MGPIVGIPRKLFGMAAARAYISEVRWKFAKTMPEWPHEYTVKEWRPDLVDQFERFCWLIHDEGLVEPWPPAPARTIYRNQYLVICGHKYWAMGPLGDSDPIAHKTVINRTVLSGTGGDLLT